MTYENALIFVLSAESYSGLLISRPRKTPSIRM